LTEADLPRPITEPSFKAATTAQGSKAAPDDAAAAKVAAIHVEAH